MRFSRLLFFALAFTSAAVGPLQAQEEGGTVTGRVVSLQTEQPLVSISVVVRSTGDSTRVALVTTGFDGSFRVRGLAPGQYFLEISGIGHGTRTTEPFEAESGTIHQFGTITLSEEAIPLDPINVESVRSAVTYEADRTSYAVDALPGVEGGVITDALRNVPDVEVDLDGNVEIRGERPAIWIDGRPAPVIGQSLAQFLEQFPADLLDRIEVLDNPGAEYDAEGTGGILNIVLREGVDLGISGSVFANAGTRGNTGLGGRATMQRGNWVHDGNLSLRRMDSEVESYLWRQNLAATHTDIVERESRNGNESLGGSLGWRSSWTPRDEARLNLRLDMGTQGGDRGGSIFTTFRGEEEAPTLRFERSDLSETEGRSLGARADFQWRWVPRRHELDAEVRVVRGRDLRLATQEILSDEDLSDEAAFVPAELTLDDESGLEREYRFDVNYRRPLGESGSVRTGYSLRDQNQETIRTLTFTGFGDSDDQDDILVRGHDRRERVQALYTTLQGNLSALSLQVGLRAEHSELELEFPGAQGVTRQDTHLFPSANLSWRIDNRRRVRLSYSQRVGRPGVGVLDPNDRSTDPLERVVGNPDIDPRITHRINLNASWTTGIGTLSLSPFANRTLNGWERVTLLDSSGVTTQSWDNLSSQTSVGSSVNMSFRGIGEWRSSVNANASRAIRDVEGLDPRFSRTSSSWGGRLNVSGPLVGDLTMQSSLRYRASSRNLQGRDGSQTSVDLSFRYRFMNRRGSASLALQDPLGLQRSATEIRDASLWEIRESSRDTRSARLSLSWTFGGSVRGPRH